MVYTPKNPIKKSAPPPDGQLPAVPDHLKDNADVDPEVKPLTNEESLNMAIVHTNSAIDYLALTDPTDSSIKAIGKLSGALKLLS